MNNRRFFTEFAVNMLAELRILVQQEDLPRLTEAGVFAVDPCHIYSIVRRPRVSFIPSSIAIDDEKISGVLRIQKQHEFEEVQFAFANEYGRSGMSARCEFPNSVLRILDDAGSEVLILRGSVLLTKLQNLQDLANYEVLYVGQSYGVDGARTAPERLMAHSTLQGIYHEALQHSPDQEIWILLMSFQPPIMLMSFDGRSQDYQTSVEEDEAHYHRVLQTDISEQ
jgi:hypothetical protein